jgi:serine/threonine protein kinase
VIVTAFYNGGELFEKLYEYAYSEKDAVVWMKQILYAIQSLHSNGIVHRDIKPVGIARCMQALPRAHSPPLWCVCCVQENFVLDSQDRSAKLRLIDFGGALQGPDDMEVKDVVATPSFVAPEVGWRCDV